MTHSAGQETLLTDLCGICHSNPIKYTCPRCGLHTCSLQCVKRHKLLAQCSGVRNPAAFKKRQDLATASSIDQDYNFITKLERSLKRADDNNLEKGINLAPAGIARPYAGKPRFEEEAEKDAITIIKAPKGLSRSKQNKSHWNHKQNCTLWTIEWRTPEGKAFFSNSQSTRLLMEAYRLCVGKKGLPRKRRREDDAATAMKQQEVKQDDKGDEVVGKEAASGDPGPSALVATLGEGLNFYLHRPNTSSKYKCLIPVSQSESIGEALRNKTLLEFPTIYVRMEPPENLAEPFITEADYLQNHRSDIPVDLPSFGNNGLKDGQIAVLPDNIDDRKVLEVLQRDISG